MTHLTVPLDNLGYTHREAEAARAARVLAQVPGVVRASVNAATEMAYVEFEPGQISPAVLLAALAQSGFGAADPAPLAGEPGRAPILPEGERPRARGGKPTARGLAWGLILLAVALLLGPLRWPLLLGLLLLGAVSLLRRVLRRAAGPQGTEPGAARSAPNEP